jgi:hypothetical protein
MRFWVSALVAVAFALAAAYIWVRWPPSRWLRLRRPHDQPDALASLKTIVEISAVLVAGIWTYDHFLRFDEPSLKTSFRFKAELERDPILTSPNCLLIVKANAENFGKTDFSIKRVTQRIWQVSDGDLWTTAPGAARFIDLESLTKEDPAKRPMLANPKVSEPDGPLAYRYVPGASASYDFPWALHETSDTIVVRFDFDIDDDQSDFFFTWGKPCVQESTSERQPSPPPPDTPQQTQSK